MVTLLSVDSMVPSTSPSTLRSSLVKIWPITLTAFPMVAVLRESASGTRWGVDDNGLLSFLISGMGGATGGAGGRAGGATAGRGAGCSSFLFQILTGFSFYSMSAYDFKTTE